VRRNPSDRRKVVIQPVLEKMEAELALLFASMVQEMEELLSGYSDQELAIIQDFVSLSITVRQAEITQLSEDSSSAETP
jgi:DNA-binding MarR family transcriptional regulator